MSLIKFCYKGDLEGVKGALQSGADVNTEDEDGWTGLMWAVDENHNSVVELLLKTPNIDVNLKSNWGACSLHLAVGRKNNEALNMLLDVPNINVNIVYNYGVSAVLMAVFANNIEMLKLLLSHPNIDVNLKHHSTGTCALLHAVTNRKNDALKLLLNVPNIDVNIVDNHGRSAVHQAMYSDNIEVSKLLLSHPNLTALTLNMKDQRYGETPVMWAVIRKSNVALNMMLNVPGIDVNIVDNNGKSALHQAVDFNNIEALKLLLGHPLIDVNSVVNSGRGAAENDELKLLDVTGIDFNSGSSAVWWAVDENNIEVLKLLLSHPSLTALTLNQKGKRYGVTPVMLAVRWNSLEILAMLAADPRVDVDTTDREGRSLEEVARNPDTRRVLDEAKQRREEKKRLIREQKRQVSKVLLDGLYDSDSPIFKLLGVRRVVIGEIMWKKMLAWNWQIFPDPANPAWL